MEALTTQALYVSDSKNAKIASPFGVRVDATYAGFDSCPASCAFRTSKSCYAMMAHVGFTANRLSGSKQPSKIAREEASKIDASYRGGEVPPVLLRLHVAGDCSTKRAASIVGNAAKRWINRGGMGVWAYTHAWRTVPRSSWRSVSILGSIEDPNDAMSVIAQGYAPALVVKELPAKPWKSHGVTWIPCPAQLKATACNLCKLCLKADKLSASKQGIAFGAHGARVKAVRSLCVI